MSYLEEFRVLIEQEKLSAFLHLWEEYCLGDQVNGEECFYVLKIIKDSSFAAPFGKVAETAIPLWEKIEDEDMAGHVLALIVDLQTTQSPLLASLAIQYLSSHYKEDPDFNTKMRLVGLRTRQSFRGAITNFKLLTHMEKGKFVFHTGGWGVGEIMESSLSQEHVLLEFEGIGACKDLSFENAFKNLIYLPSDHFLARRFGHPDALEAEGREDPLVLVHLVLRDLGPKTAQELKEELCELVIPEKDWSKWWQTARTKIKKDTRIRSPESSKEPFALLEHEISRETLFHRDLEECRNPHELIHLVYQYFRDFPKATRTPEIREPLKEKLLEALQGTESIVESLFARKLQVSFLLEDLFPEEFSRASVEIVRSLQNPEGVINLIEILAYKKRLLIAIRQYREDWQSIFSHLFLLIGQNGLRDYIFKELFAKNSSSVTEKIQELLQNMTLYVEPFFWYFQKILSEKEIPLSDTENRYLFLEAYLILLHYIEDKEEYRDLTKKMYNLLIAERFAVIRQMIAGASLPFLKEFLLLASKCLIFSKQEQCTLRSLAEVVQPVLADKKKEEPDEIIWTTQEGFIKTQERLKAIGTVEMIDNAREIEEARAHGDLRENSEYKFALERRSRLQAELGALSKQLNHARILTKEDVSPSQVGPGSIVSVVEEGGEPVRYTLLGPWDADPERHILSFQSKFAQAMLGKKVGATFDFQGTNYCISEILSYLEESSR